jgi:hypothetical protein
MKTIVLIALLASSAAAQFSVAEVPVQINRDGRWLKAQIQSFEKAQVAVADSTTPLTHLELMDAMFLAGYVTGIISADKFHSAMGAQMLLGIYNAVHEKRVSSLEAKGFRDGIILGAPLTDTEFSKEQYGVDQYVQAIKNYLEKHPDKWSLGADAIIEFTLWEMFPSHESK